MLADDYLAELSLILARDPLDIDSISEASDLIKTIEACPITNVHRTQLVAFKKLIENKKLEILFGGGIDPNKHSNRSVEWLQSKNNRLNLLLKSRQQLVESEEVAKETIEELANQEETISRATKKTKQANDSLSWASKLATKMNSIWR